MADINIQVAGIWFYDMLKWKTYVGIMFNIVAGICLRYGEVAMDGLSFTIAVDGKWIYDMVVYLSFIFICIYT